MTKKKARKGGRSSIDGRWVPIEDTYRQPNTTQREMIPLPGHGDTGRSKKAKRKK